MIKLDFENINEKIVYEAFGVDGNEPKLRNRHQQREKI